MQPTLFFDCGDTLIDESTEVTLENDKGRGPLVESAQLIPGADRLLRTLKERDYRLALVADGLTQSFKNILEKLDLWDLFETHAISEEVGVMKPHRRMFETAAREMGLGPERYGEIFMVGNNLSRDILGANSLGMVSVFLDWSPRYPSKPSSSKEIPRYTITKPLDLLPILEEWEENR